MAVERQLGDIEIRQLAEINFNNSLPPKETPSSNRTANQPNGKELKPGQRVIVVNGKRMIATDLGVKGLKGCFEAMKPRGLTNKKEFRFGTP